MSLPPDPDSRATSGWKGSVVVYGSIVLAIWLGWEIVKAPIAQRAPAEIAVRLAPGSPAVLARAAEGELTAGRMSNAAFVARASLARAPFNAQALRVLGLALAEGSAADANAVLTLAGNLSLRDNATHGWLVEQRLRSGDYASAFAHADTLVRRRIELGPQVFNLYTTAAKSDPRALSALVNLIGTRPRWRQDYLEYLYAEGDRAPLLAALVVALEPSSGRLSDAELRELYGTWRRQNRIPGLRLLRETLQRPPSRPYIKNSGFEDEAQQLLPFGWTLGFGAGIAASVTDSGDGKHRNALWIEYDGFASGLIAEQLVMLSPGAVVVSGEWRADGSGSDRVGWQIVCIGTERTLASATVPLTSNWTRLSLAAQIPASGCEVQALRLVGVPGDFRRPVSAWLDNLEVSDNAT